MKIKIESFVTFHADFYFSSMPEIGASKDIPKKWPFNYPTVILLSYESFCQNKCKKLRKCIYNLFPTVFTPFLLSCMFFSHVGVINIGIIIRRHIEWFTNELRELKAEISSSSKGCL